jgi:hypothetical protein
MVNILFLEREGNTAHELPLNSLNSINHRMMSWRLDPSIWNLGKTDNWTLQKSYYRDM